MKNTKQIKTGARFFVGDINIEKDAILRLPSDVADHAFKALRLTPEAIMRVFNKKGCEYTAQILNRTEVKIIEEIRTSVESPLKVTMAQTLVSNEKMRWIIQKATEFGVHTICVFPSERTKKRQNMTQMQKKIEHWNRVIIASCEQCGRGYIPDIQIFPSFAAYLSQLKDTVENEKKIILTPNSEVQIHDLPTTILEITAAIGPEGGFTNDEITLAKKWGFKEIRLGPRTLRTETAGLGFIAAAQAKWGDL